MRFAICLVALVGAAMGAATPYYAAPAPALATSPTKPQTGGPMPTPPPTYAPTHAPVPSTGGPLYVPTPPPSTSSSQPGTGYPTATATPCPKNQGSGPTTSGAMPPQSQPPSYYAPAESSSSYRRNKRARMTGSGSSPTKTPCPTSGLYGTSGGAQPGYAPGYTAPVSGQPMGALPAPGPNPGTAPGVAPAPAPMPAAAPSPSASPAPITGSSVTSADGAESEAVGDTSVSVAADKKSGVASANADDDGAVLAAAQVGAAVGLSTSARQATYTDGNGVQYYQDPATGQWYYCPSPTPLPKPSSSPAPAPGSSIELDGGVAANGRGDNSVSAGASKDQAAASGNGLNGVLAAALASPGAPAALGFAF